MRECPLCPKEVLRCAHFDGRTLWLHGYSYVPGELFVCEPVKDFRAHVEEDHPDYATFDPSEAEAEFARREALLLAQEVEA